MVEVTNAWAEISYHLFTVVFFSGLSFAVIFGCAYLIATSVREEIKRRWK